MTPEEKVDFDKTLMRSSAELPYPMNYMRHYNPGMAYMTVKIFDLIKERRLTSSEER